MPTNKNKYSAKPLKNIESVKNMAVMLRIMQKLKKEHELYLNDLFLLCTIYRENLSALRAINRKELLKAYPFMWFRLEQMIERLKLKGFIIDSSVKPAKSNILLSLTPAGEQLLIKYDRSLRKMSNTVNRYQDEE